MRTTTHPTVQLLDDEGATLGVPGSPVRTQDESLALIAELQERILSELQNIAVLLGGLPVT